MSAPAISPRVTAEPDPRRGASDGRRPEADERPSLRGLRLALVSDTWAPQLNGVTRTLERLVDAVHERGGDVDVFTVDDPEATSVAGVRRHASIPFWAYPQLRLAAPGAGRLARDLRRWGATLVHAATPFGMGLAARAGARRAGIPFVTSYHTHFTAYAPHYELGRLVPVGERFLRWFHNGGARTYCPTAAVASDLAERGFERTAVWGRGVDPDLFSPIWRTPTIRSHFGLRDHQLLVLYVGRVAKVKGIDDLLEAMRLLRQLPDAPPCHLLIIGDGPYLDACRRRSSAGVSFGGRAAGTTLSRLYASADLFVFPSTTDTFGNVTLEAMASALPVVAADCAVTRELLVAGAGSFYRSGDAAELAAHIARWGRDPALRRIAGERARRSADARRWSRVFDTLFEDYLTVAAAPSQTA